MFQRTPSWFLWLHTCHYCGKRLKRSMPIVARPLVDEDNAKYDWYCSKECAKAEAAAIKSVGDCIKLLNKYIRGEK